MARYSVKMVPPNIANDIREVNDGTKKLEHPYYKVEERKGSGKATCRQCGDVIKENENTVYFHYAPDGDNEWIRDRGTIHREDCGSGENTWTKCPKCMQQVPRDQWSKHWKGEKKKKVAGDHGPDEMSDFENQFSDSRQVKDDLTDMKAKDIADKLWDAIGGNDLPTHCPSCGSADTEFHKQKLDEDQYPYDEHKCNECGTKFDKDESGSGMNFTLTTPQVFHDSWRDKDRKANFKGNCIGCGKKTFAFEDGENDPRGPLGDHAASPLIASEHDMTGPDVPLCFGCSNEYDSYRKASDYGERIWKDDPEAQAETARRNEAWKNREKESSTSGNEDELDEEGKMPNGWKPRVDQNTQDAQKKTQWKQVNQEATELVKNMHGLDNFAGSNLHLPQPASDEPPTCRCGTKARAEGGYWVHPAYDDSSGMNDDLPFCDSMGEIMGRAPGGPDLPPIPGVEWEKDSSWSATEYVARGPASPWGSTEEA